MRTYTIKLERDLSDLVSSAIEEIKDSVTWLYLKEGSIDETMDKHDIIDVLQYDGTLHEIIDGSVPVYTAELKALMFVHEWALMEAFNDAGMCTVDEVLKNPDSYVLGLEGIAIYHYIDQEVSAWMEEDLEDWFIEKFGAN
tara:strand:- start:10225 stop:10647 length:423 start_codon:yes stop_codon:yes gene_type:complete